MNIWRAGGVENDQRGAWSSLVAAHGSGRAGWLADNFQPVNLAAEPSQDRSHRRDSCHSDHDTVVLPQTAAAISTYWQSVWLADGDAGENRRCQRGFDCSRRRGAGRRTHLRLRAFQSCRLSHGAVDQGERRAFGGVRGVSSRSRRPPCNRGRKRRRFDSFPIASSYSDSTELRKRWKRSAAR